MGRDREDSKSKSSETQGIIPREFIFKDYYIKDGQVKMRNEADDLTYLNIKKSDRDRNKKKDY